MKIQPCLSLTLCTLAFGVLYKGEGTINHKNHLVQRFTLTHLHQNFLVTDVHDKLQLSSIRMFQSSKCSIPDFCAQLEVQT